MELRVATYNVHGFRGADRRRDVVRVARVVRSLRADVVALQEVDTRGAPMRLAELAERTGHHPVAGATLWSRRGGFYGNALLTHGRPVSVAHVDISVPRAEPRSVLDVELELGDGPLRVLVAHFGLSGRERRYQTDALERLLREDQRPLVLMGDFNEWRPRGYTLLRLGARLGPARRARSFPARLPLLALDRIWVRPAAAVVDVRAQRTPLAVRASDHLPVVARLDRGRLRATP